MSNLVPTPISDDEVVALTRAALEDSRKNLGISDGTINAQSPGTTIDLGYNNIARMPDEAIELIRTDIERLALSHNLLSTLPQRMVECNHLRYLNIRYNSMSKIPDVIFELKSLEILDMSRNKLTSIPSKIANLTSLKVLAVTKNKLQELPLSLGEIDSLVVLRFDDNPLFFPPTEIRTIGQYTPQLSTGTERYTLITTQIKKFLRQCASQKEKQANVE